MMNLFDDGSVYFQLERHQGWITSVLLSTPYLLSIQHIVTTKLAI